MKNWNDQNRNTRPALITCPFFSIIITTYNRAQLLRRALDSLLSQTEADWEAIIIDDESTDDTYLQILPYLSSNPKIKYVRKEHSGEVLSKNEGIYSSRGKFISFLDSDDEYDPVHLASRKGILMQHPSLEFLYGGAMIIGNQFVPDRFDYSKKINLNKCVIGGTFLVQRKILLALHGFRKMPIGTDGDLFDRARNAGIAMMEVITPTYIYHRETQNSITTNLCVAP